MVAIILKRGKEGSVADYGNLCKRNFEINTTSCVLEEKRHENVLERLT